MLNFITQVGLALGCAAMLLALVACVVGAIWLAARIPDAFSHMRRSWWLWRYFSRHFVESYGARKMLQRIEKANRENYLDDLYVVRRDTKGNYVDAESEAADA